MDKLEMEAGKIYFIEYGSNTSVLVRFKESDACNHMFFAHLHYWNGYESFHKNGHSVKSGISNIREATKPEKHHLIKFEIENGTI